MIQKILIYYKLLRSGIFDPHYYLSNNPDVREADIDPLLHFIQLGWKEGRDPSPQLSMQEYFKKFPELQKGNIQAAVPFLLSKNEEEQNSQLDAKSLNIEEKPDVTNGTNQFNHLDEEELIEPVDFNIPSEGSSSFGNNLVYGLEKKIPSEIFVGKGAYYLLKGWCFAPGFEIDKVSICIDDDNYNIHNHSYYSKEATDRYALQYNDYKSMLFSGFWGMIPFRQIDHPINKEIFLRIKLKDGRQVEEKLAEIKLIPENREEIRYIVKENNAEPLVAICMATYNPPIDLFTKQIESLVNQTHKNWICIIQDDHSTITKFNQIISKTKLDKRFIVSRNQSNLGHYYNFETALKKVPPEAAFVAYCDQDDEWYPNKISRSLAEFKTEKVMLAYCDMNIEDQNGVRTSNTFWGNRRNNYSSLGALIFANTVTGAASMFRASIIKDLLPFPENLGDDYHDHWTACVALAKGKIAYVDEQLYAYIQHSNNAYGMHGKLEPFALIPELRLLLNSRGNFSVYKHNIKAILERLEGNYQTYLLRRILISKYLLLRINKIPFLKKATIKQVASAESSVFGLVWQTIIYYLCKRPTFGYEINALRSFIGHNLLSIAWRWKSKKIIERIHLDSSQNNSQISISPRKIAPINTVQSEDSAVLMVKQMTAPLLLNFTNDEPQRINIIMATVDFKYVFGGYLAMFNLAKKIAQFGNQVRIIIVEPCDYNPEEWRRQIQAYPGLEDLLDYIETSYHYDRSIPLSVNKDDIFIATSCWTAHIANQAVNDLKSERFIFFAQEYEPIFFPMGTFHALSRQSYFLPQYTIFSTELLREFFRNGRIGVYKNGELEGNENSIVINNAIHSFNISIEDLKERKKKKFLFYARPESHAARNMYELGILGIIDSVQKGMFDEDWEIHGIGTIGNNRRVSLGNGREFNFIA